MKRKLKEKITIQIQIYLLVLNTATIIAHLRSNVSAYRYESGINLLIEVSQEANEHILLSGL